MGRAFTEEELTTYYIKLISSGRKFAEKYGFKKTSIDQVIEDVGISKGMFYKFFPSKESFFFEVREEVEQEVHSMIKNIFVSNKKNHKDKLVDDLCNILRIIREPKYALFFDINELTYILKRLPKNEIKFDVHRDIIVTEDILKMIGISTDSKQIDVSLVTGIMRSIFITSMNSTSIGEDAIDKVVRFQIQSMVNYISN